MSDTWTMIWKELKDELFQGNWQALVRPVLFIGILGIVFPLQDGMRWIDLAPLQMVLVTYFPFLFILNFIGDAIAGERERHTLETLLASRISDRAILLGKVFVTVGYAWGMAFISLLLGCVSVNLVDGSGSWRFYSVNQLLITLALVLLTALLASSGGVLISLRSATVRQAQQNLIIATLGLGVVILLALKFVPANLISALSYDQLILIIMGFLGALDAFFLVLSLVTFRRARLILS
jgi:ABC-2 type transport system permease protein